MLQRGGVLCPQPECGMGLLPEDRGRRVICPRGPSGGCVQWCVCAVCVCSVCVQCVCAVCVCVCASACVQCGKGKCAYKLQMDKQLHNISHNVEIGIYMYMPLLPLQ